MARVGTRDPPLGRQHPVMLPETILQLDRQHIWHPYTAQASPVPVYPVASAQGCRLRLSNQQELLDGMSSWWSVIHGYNHPELNDAITRQLNQMAHVMFGGLTHEPAVQLATTLADIAPPGLPHVFFVDSGSVAVEVALKMALQYWHAKGQHKRTRFLALRGAYHGDTFLAMSVCDPDTGMHHLFQPTLPPQYFVPRPRSRFGTPASTDDIHPLLHTIAQHADELAGVILEPIVQGAGGMWFYSADYLQAVRHTCDQYGLLMIADEIATGFGRTGKLFACEHAHISPDILCVGKALTGGYMTLAATLCTAAISSTIEHSPAGALMHGPTFMANPLACSVANASLALLQTSDWRSSVCRLEQGLRVGLSPLATVKGVHDVRVLGAIGVVELIHAVDMSIIQPLFVQHGIWVRPFGKLVYLMPPFVMTDTELAELAQQCCKVITLYLSSTTH